MNHISLFTGIGGIDLASEWAGFDTILQVENEPYCLQVLEKHWPTVERCTDIRSLNGRKYRGSVDLVSGGFPCQPYSGAGKRKAFDDDRDLWPEMFRIIQEVRPTWVLGENVANFVNLGIDRTILNLESENYAVQCFNIPACAVNAWHQRARIFVVAYSESNKEERTLRATESIDATGDSRLESTGGGDRLEKGRTGQAMADSRRNAEGSKEKPERPSGNTSGCSSRTDSRIKETVADSDIKGLQRGKEAVQQSPGFSRPGEEFWKSEPNVGRVAHGVQNRVHRLRALGNAVVPQQVSPILEAIAKIHKGEIN